MCHYVESLAENNVRVVTVNVYNPHVKDEDVRAFLGDIWARLLKDTLGFGMGGEAFRLSLRTTQKGLEGYVHKGDVVLYLSASLLQALYGLRTYFSLTSRRRVTGVAR
jgi:hypothetical protein